MMPRALAETKPNRSIIKVLYSTIGYLSDGFSSEAGLVCRVSQKRV
jgi:hypothetical protein